ncbi:hypothetical protein EON83_05155 [bacterium]|nr:MAG: hypothetical protein EON83_05155 [bacterium]
MLRAFSHCFGNRFVNPKSIKVYFGMKSSRLFRPTLLTLLVGAAFSAGFSLRAQGQNDASFDLVTYRTALEQLRAGRPQNAQLLLEAARKGGPLATENALLLAYLEDASGQSEEARTTLSALTTPSPMAGAYLRRLGGVIPATQQTQVTMNAARLVTSDARLTKLEAFMIDVVNDERAKQGLSRLQPDSQLAEVARAHSAEMRDKKYFAHESPTLSIKMPLDRYVAGFGTTPRIVAENIYHVWGSRSFLTQSDTREAHTSLMNSPGHRANLLNRDVTRIGIGFCTDKTGNLWITQMFSRLP